MLISSRTKWINVLRHVSIFMKTLASSHIAKALQVSLASDETFQYDKND